MNFEQFEKIMSSNGILSLAEIARSFDTTPQAVSNWKARNQVPNHVILEVKEKFAPNVHAEKNSNNVFLEKNINIEKENISLPDLLVILADQLKVILLIPFLFVFLTFINIKFIQIPQYTSSATLVIPDKQSSGGMGGFAGIASQFGVNIQSGVQADLSSPDILPKLIFSNIFAEKILFKEFLLSKNKKEIPLINIIIDSNEDIAKSNLGLINKGSREFRKMISFEDSKKDPMSRISITSSDPLLSKQLAETVLTELEELNRSYKSQIVSEKILFIDQRINSVINELEASEKRLKSFNEQNRQISSPSLQLEQDRLLRDVEVQKGIYLTLKQQFELAKIEEIQQASIFQVLDKPSLPQAPSSNRLVLKIILSAILGFTIAILIGLSRSFLKNAGIKERKKIRKVKLLFLKKFKELFVDPYVSLFLALSLLSGLPFLLKHKSKNPDFFDLYSSTALVIIIFYISIILLLFSKSFANKKKY